MEKKRKKKTTEDRLQEASVIYQEINVASEDLNDE